MIPSPRESLTPIFETGSELLLLLGAGGVQVGAYDVLLRRARSIERYMHHLLEIGSSLGNLRTLRAQRPAHPFDFIRSSSIKFASSPAVCTSAIRSSGIEMSNLSSRVRMMFIRLIESTARSRAISASADTAMGRPRTFSAARPISSSGGTADRGSPAHHLRRPLVKADPDRLVLALEELQQVLAAAELRLATPPPKYGRCACDEIVVEAPAPTRPLEDGLPTEV